MTDLRWPHEGAQTGYACPNPYHLPSPTSIPDSVAMGRADGAWALQGPAAVTLVKGVVGLVALDMALNHFFPKSAPKPKRQRAR